MTPEEAAGLAQAARMSALHLQTLVNNLLESASLEAGIFRLRPRPAALQELLQQVVQMMAPLLQRRRQSLRLEAPAEPLTVWLDPDRVSQVLVNLIGNASKFSPTASAILLTARLEPDCLRVAVEDSGPGFPGAGFNELVDRTPAQPPVPGSGIGLGLSIVKSLVQAHQGELGVENRPQGGARVWFTLPLGPQEQRE